MKKPSLLTKVAVGTVALGLGVSLIPGAIATDEYVANGLTTETAAASCWEIKQNNPESESGAYWLWTPQMDAPAQFYCDQETNGGGWVMIGRGRDGWTEDYNGKGDPKELYTNPDGTSAFSPVQLSASTVDALLGGTKVQDLADGVRFYRAGNAKGTVWQNMYAKRTKTEKWSWTLSAYHPWEDVRYDNDPSLAPNRTTALSVNRISNDNNYYYANNFYGRSSQQWKLGFGYGGAVAGVDTADSYLWSPRGIGYALPFTQVFVRPQLTQADLKLETIADSGTAEKTQRSVPASFSSRVSWRTSTNSGTGSSGELNTRVQAINQLGDTVFTGGDFAYVENAVTGEKVQQKFIAGYDVNTGELVRSFTPVLNGQVKAISPLPNGMLAVGGEFTRVNGEPNNGFVILDPVTGQIDKSLGWDVVNRNASGVSFVKSIDVHGNYVYIAGNFTHVKGSTSDVYAYSKNVARYRLNNNSVDWSWRPITNGTVNGISASDEGVAIAGYFSTLNDQRAWKLGYINTTNGQAAQDWEWTLSHRNANPTHRDGFQFDVQDAGSTVWAAGAEHLLAQYEKANIKNRLTTYITKSGGDFQDLSMHDGVIYAACHCGDWIYAGATTHDTPWNAATYKGVNTIRLIAAFDAETGEMLPQFNPGIQGQRGHGIWASFTDSNGTLWVGGDITRSLGYNGVQQTVGFARYASNDSTAPALASNLSASSDGSVDTLTWDGVREAGVTYQILRNNRVIASTNQTTYRLPSTEDARYFVRVADAAGNLSASTPVAEVTRVAVAEPTAEVTEEPAVEEPATEEPVAEEPTAEATEEAVAEEVTAEEEQPADEEAAEEEPVVKPIEEIADEVGAPRVEEDEAPLDPVTPVEAPRPADRQVIANGDNWDVAFRLNNAYDTTWRDYDYKYDTAAMWYEAKTPVGWGETGLARRVYFPYSATPMSFFVRKELTVAPEAGQDLVITTYADDGIALYVNGKEVHRQNLAQNAFPETPALARALYREASANPITVVVPASELREGKNVIAAEIHSFRRGEGTTFSMEASYRAP